MAELDAICVEPLSLAKSVMIPSNIHAPKEIDGKKHFFAYVNGEAKYVPIRSNNDVISGSRVASKYNEKLCAFAVDDEGYYYVRCLSNSYDEEGNYNGIEKDYVSGLWNRYNENNMFIEEDARVVSPLQRIDGENNIDRLYIGSRDNIEDATLSDYSKVIVRTYFPEKGTYEYATYDKDALLLSALSNDGLINLGHKIPTETLSYIVSNNVNSYDSENLVVAYVTNTYELGSGYDLESFKEGDFTYRWSTPTYLPDGNVSLTATHTDISIGINNMKLDTSLYNVIRIRVKDDFDAEPSDLGQLFFRRTTDAAFEESRSLRFRYAAQSVEDGDGWKIIELDLSGLSMWNGFIEEIRFDPVDLMGTFTVDYIRFIKGGKHQAMTDEELEALYTPTSLLYDNGFENGFDVRPIVNSYNPEGYFEYTDSGDSSNNLWAICPWWTHDGDGLSPSNYVATSLIHNRADTDEYTIADKKGSKVVTYHPDDNSLTMTLNGSKIYDGTPHIKDDPSTTGVNEENRRWWPHLLIEQDPTICEVDKEVHSADADRVVCELDIRMPQYSPTTNKEGTNACQYLIYFYLFLKDDVKRNQRIWFGVGLFDDRGGIRYVPTWNRDSAANQMMYCVPQETVYGGMENSYVDIGKSGDVTTYTPVPSNEWRTLRIDLTPHLDKVVDWANRDNSFGREVTREDLYFGGVNLGFETHGNVDCTFEIRNFDLVSYN